MWYIMVIWTNLFLEKSQMLLHFSHKFEKKVKVEGNVTSALRTEIKDPRQPFFITPILIHTHTLWNDTVVKHCSPPLLYAAPNALKSHQRPSHYCRYHLRRLPEKQDSTEAFMSQITLFPGREPARRF